MALNALAIRNATPREQPYKLPDGDGLHLLVNPNGSKLWRFKYHFADKEKLLSLGSYPTTTLAEVRSRRDEQRTDECDQQAERQRAKPWHASDHPIAPRRLDLAIYANRAFFRDPRPHRSGGTKEW